jgi:hypothetical protein
MYEHQIVKIDDLIPYALNSRTHSEQQVAQIAASIREFGFTNPVLIDDQNNLIAGHGRVLAARKLKMQDIPAIIVTGLDERKRRALIIADNKLALNAGWDDKTLKIELEDLAGEFGDLMGFDKDELFEILEKAAEDSERSLNAEKYTAKIETPIYEIKGDEPEIQELYDLTKTNQLVERIMQVDMPDEFRGFLMSAATRHTVYNYEKIAEFYAHQDESIKSLMRDSALVIIDFNEAIEKSYVKLTKTLMTLSLENDNV